MLTATVMTSPLTPDFVLATDLTSVCKGEHDSGSVIDLLKLITTVCKGEHGPGSIIDLIRLIEGLLCFMRANLAITDTMNHDPTVNLPGLTRVDQKNHGFTRVYQKNHGFTRVD